MENKIKGVPSVSSLTKEGEGMRITELVASINDLSDAQKEEFLRMLFVKTVEKSLEKGTNEGLVEVLQHCNMYPMKTPSDIEEAALWKRRISLFRIAYDCIVANAKPRAVKRESSSERRNWHSREMIEKFLDAVQSAKGKTFREIGEQFGNLPPTQVGIIFNNLRNGDYEGIGFPKKEYDPEYPRQKGRRAS